MPLFNLPPGTLNSSICKATLRLGVHDGIKRRKARTVLWAAMGVKGHRLGNHPLHPGFRKIWLTLYERVVYKLRFQAVKYR